MQVKGTSENADHGGLQEFYERTYLRLLYVAMGILHKKEDAEEIVGDVYLTLLEKEERYRGMKEEELLALGIVMVRNACINRIRERERHEETPIELHDNSLEGEGDLLEGILVKERREALREALLKLSEKERDVLVLKYFQGLSYREIGEALKIREKTVEVRLRRAKKHLKKYLEEVMENEGDE